MSHKSAHFSSHFLHTHNKSGYLCKSVKFAQDIWNKGLAGWRVAVCGRKKKKRSCDVWCGLVFLIELPSLYFIKMLNNLKYCNRKFQLIMTFSSIGVIMFIFSQHDAVLHFYSRILFRFYCKFTFKGLLCNICLNNFTDYFCWIWCQQHLSNTSRGEQWKTEKVVEYAKKKQKTPVWNILQVNRFSGNR